jgi:hypothetical protein
LILMSLISNTESIKFISFFGIKISYSYQN